MQVIYLDTLFLLNGIVDYVLLLASARVAGEPLSRGRFLLGAILGGGYAVAIFLFPFLTGGGYKLLVFLLMMLVAYGKSEKLLRQILIFLALSAGLAGGILAIVLTGGEGLTLQGGVLYSSMDLKIVLLSASICYALVTTVFQNFATHTKASGELVSVSFQLFGQEVDCLAMVDTGNTLKDPISGLPVLVVETKTLSALFPAPFPKEKSGLPYELMSHYKEHPIAQRMRLIPYQAVGVQGLLLVLKMDQITLNQQVIPSTLVGLSPTPVSDGGSYKALVGANCRRGSVSKK